MATQLDVTRQRSFDFAVIGAGVIGASTARELARRGASVVVLDRASGVGGGCSYANAGILAPDHVSPLATPALLREAPLQMVRRPPAVRVRPASGLAPWLGELAASATPTRARVAQARLRQLANESTHLHRELGAHSLNPTLRKTGAIDVYLRRPRGRVAGLLSPTEVRDLEPGLAPVAGGLHHTEEWVVESRSYVRAMLDDAMAHGAEVLFGAQVQHQLLSGGRVAALDTTLGRIRVGHVVLASGVDSGVLADQVGVRLPLRGGRGYVVDVAAPDGALAQPVRLKEHRVVITPLPDRVRVAGSIEFGDEARFADLRRADALFEVATRAVPGLRGAPVLDRWAGERPCTPDGVPVIGPTHAVPNLSVATGHGMWGLILAPVTARLIAGQAIDHRDDPGLAWLSPDRFARRGAVLRRSIA
ncbi:MULTISPECIES: NAD(P)/FAD-dependent oxidoreductase [unclassified Knoellia]|uniref:NAD(P)/FAD-dependent oxidoreductase n=1 Tax=Knoellia altitudinis TaxID=3404795 RepID=UPI00361BD9C7